jgi:hypothetical protein
MSILDFLDTGEHRIVPADYFTHPTFQTPALPDREVITKQIWPHSFRRPDASGEHPVYEPQTIAVVDEPSAEETARITIPVTYGTPAEPADEPRPWFFRGTRRWTRSRALLFAATWPGGVR